jgi:hypothetical protein
MHLPERKISAGKGEQDVPALTCLRQADTESHTSLKASGYYIYFFFPELE